MITWLRPFFDVKHHIMARIFLSFMTLYAFLIVILGLIWYTSSSSALRRASEENLNAALSTAVGAVDRAIADIDRLEGTLLYNDKTIEEALRDTWSSPNSSWFARYNRLLGMLQTMITHLDGTMSGIALYTTSGHSCIAGTMSPSYSQEDSLWFTQAFADTRSGFTMPHPRTYAPDFQKMPNSLLILRRVQTQAGVRGVLVSELNPGVIYNALDAQPLREGHVILLDAGGTVLYDGAPDDALREAMLNGAQAKDYFTVRHESEKSGIIAVAAHPAAEFARALSDLRGQFAVLLLISTTAVGFCSILLSRSITSGLKTLADNMRRDGYDMKPVNSRDEVGELQTVFEATILRNRQLMADIREEERNQRLLEIQVLQAQIAPHFLYNALNTIAYLAEINKAENIRRLTVALIDLMHGAIRHDELIPVADEIKYVQSYLHVQQYRSPRDIEIEIDTGEGVASLRMARMLLQPIVENAVIHGLEGQEEPRLALRLWTEADALLISVRDNGVGMTPQRLDTVVNALLNRHKSRFSGVGLRSVQQRIWLKYGENYGLTIDSSPGSHTMVTMRLPVIREEARDANGFVG